MTDDAQYWPEQGKHVELSREVAATEVPGTLTIDEAYRAAFYLVQAYFAVEPEPDESLVLLLDYMHSDPARWGDWQNSVRRALSDEGWASRGLRVERWGAEL